MTETEKAQAQQRSMELFQKCAQQFRTKEELAIFACSIAALGIAMVRGIEGNEFTSGFLQGAITDENPPTITPVLKN